MNCIDRHVPERDVENRLGPIFCRRVFQKRSDAFVARCDACTVGVRQFVRLQANSKKFLPAFLVIFPAVRHPDRFEVRSGGNYIAVHELG
jgi:hypothetical protein